MSSTYDTGFLQLVHQSAGTVIANGELTLNQTGRTALFVNNQTGGIIKHRIQMTQVGIIAA